MLYELGLEAALQWLTEQKSREAHKQAAAAGGPATVIEFRDDGRQKPLPQPVQVLLFQAVRELLANVLRHADARWARVSIWRDDGDVLLTVEDDGAGFDPDVLVNSSRRQAGGFGIFSVRERLSHVGGQIRLDNRLGGGAKVTLVVPLRASSPPSERGARE